MPPFEALKPIEKDADIRSKMYADELKWYYKQPQPKPPKQKFYWRLQKWYTKEEAIKIELVKRERKPLNYNYNTYAPTREKKEKIITKDEKEIRIKYNGSEADIIKKEYESMIKELESLVVEDEDERTSLNERIEQLKKEYQVFISCNHDE